jgi:hypothetical protein
MRMRAGASCWMRLRFDHRRAKALQDEAPGAYTDIGQVMRARSELTRIVRRLRLVLSPRASDREATAGKAPSGQRLASRSPSRASP